MIKCSCRCGIFFAKKGNNDEGNYYFIFVGYFLLPWQRSLLPDKTQCRADKIGQSIDLANWFIAGFICLVVCRLFHGVGTPTRILQPIDQDKQQQPHHIDKVPIPSGGFKGKMVVCVKVTAKHAVTNDDQNQRADGNMQGVKASQHKEGRTVNSRRKL